MELWDLYDSQRNPLNKTHERGQPFAEGEFYVCTEIWVKNSEGKFLITNDTPIKKAVIFGNFPEVVHLPAKLQNSLLLESWKKKPALRLMNQN